MGNIHGTTEAQYCFWQFEQWNSTLNYCKGELEGFEELTKVLRRVRRSTNDDEDCYDRDTVDAWQRVVSGSIETIDSRTIATLGLGIIIGVTLTYAFLCCFIFERIRIRKKDENCNENKALEKIKNIEYGM